MVWNQYNTVMKKNTSHMYQISSTTAMRSQQSSLILAPLLMEIFRIYDELAKHLRIIKLRNIKHIVPNTLANRKLFTRKKFVQRMSQFSNLRHLEISGTSTLICGNIFCIVRSMSMLTHLNVEGTCYIHPNHVIKIMEIRPKLETLIFTHHEFQDNIDTIQEVLKGMVSSN